MLVNFNALISVADLAEQTARRGFFSKSFLYKMSAPGLPRPSRYASFPSAVVLGGKKFFVLSEVEAWIQQQLESRLPPAVQPAAAVAALRRRGRPTKKEQAEAAARGVTVAQLRQGGAA